MRVAIISTSDTGHGAGIAAYRLHKGLKASGVDSAMLVTEKRSSDDDVYAMSGSHRRISRLAEKACHAFEKKINFYGPQNIFSFVSMRMREHDIVRSADVIHFHNIHKEFGNFSLLDLFLSRRKSVVWTIHDMWPFTGHCYYSGECGKWELGCGKCPDLNGFMPVKFDSSALQWKIKRHISLKARPMLVTPSAYFLDMIKRSPVFRGLDAVRIPNGADESVFRPLDKERSRAELGIRKNAKVVLFSAHVLNDERKGYRYFEEALMALRGRSKEIVVMTAGKGGVSDAVRSAYEVRELGYLNEDLMPGIYSAADVYVMPSVEDNFPNTVIESLLCATPVVCFRTCGMIDMVEHMADGYLAEKGNAVDIKNGIEKILFDTPLAEEMKQRARIAAKNKFPISLQVKRHIELYDGLVAKRRSSV